MSYFDIPENEELGARYTRQRDNLTVACVISTGACAFLTVLGLLLKAQSAWVMSPVLAIVGVLSCVVLGLLMIVFGIITLLLSGKTHFLEVAGGIFLSSDWRAVLAVFVLSLPSLFVARVLARSYLSIRTRKILLIGSVTCMLLQIVTGFYADVARWFLNAGACVGSLF